MSIPEAVIEKELRDTLFKVDLMQPIGELEQLISKKADANSITIPWSGDAVLYHQRKELYQGYVLASAEQVLTTTIIAGILEVIRARVLEFVLAIE
ncbi:MAG TPA: hypothetical protein VHZ51_13050, partial [Ktedonobacteraceae bacterium]|nr:hypothetical protein [Ktedonobacteraceae bacterium]